MKINIELKIRRNENRINTKGQNYYSAGYPSFSEKRIQAGLLIQKLKNIVRGRHWVAKRIPYTLDNFRYFQKPYLKLPY